MIQLITDNFTRSNENPLANSNWGTIPTYGNLQIVSNVAEAVVVATNANQLWTGAGGVSADGNWANDQYAEVTVGTISAAATDSIGAGVRMGTGGTGYIVSALPTAPFNAIYKLTGAGAYTILGANFPPAAVAGDVWRIQIVGTTITVFQNGTSIATRTDATYAGGDPGIYAYAQSVLSAATITLFAAGANQAATPTLSPPGGMFSSAQTVTITSASGGTIYYTTNGTTPTHASSSIASGGTISVSTAQTVKAIASVADMADSLVGSGTYTFSGGGSDLGPSFDFRIRI